VATVRNVAGYTAWIPDAGVTVEDHDTFEVDDDLFDQRDWPEANFEVVEAPKKSKKTTSKKAAASGEKE
jgi:ribosomal protein S12